eukprot:1156975-Pelagomonas_calceolata.AAC.2
MHRRKWLNQPLVMHEEVVRASPSPAVISSFLALLTSWLLSLVACPRMIHCVLAFRCAGGQAGGAARAAAGQQCAGQPKHKQPQATSGQQAACPGACEGFNFQNLMSWVQVLQGVKI